MPPEQSNPTPEELQWLNVFLATHAAELAETSGAKAAQNFTKAMGGATPEIQQAWLESEQSAAIEASTQAAQPASQAGQAGAGAPVCEADADASLTSEAPTAEGVLRGYLYAQSVISGTRYYAQKPDGSYVYSDSEYGDDEHGWQPYEYWQNLQPAAQQEAALASRKAEQRQAVPDMSGEIEFLAQNVFSEIEEDDPEGGVYSWDEGDRERVRAYISARFKPGMTRAEVDGLKEAAIQDLLQVLEFVQVEISEQELKDFLAALTQEVSRMREVVTAIMRTRNLE